MSTTTLPWLRERRSVILFLLAFALMRTAVADWNSFGAEVGAVGDGVEVTVWC